MKKLDIEHWERKEIYDYMTTLSNPFYAVSFNIDVTNIYEYAHRKGLSFYYSLIFLVTQAFNSVPAFLNDIQNGEIIVLDHRSPSFCDIRKNSEAFYIVNLLLGNNIDDFSRRAREASKASCSLFPKDNFGKEAWIYFSCIPWVDLTCATNERDFNKDDTVPRITWGKYIEKDGKKTLNISLEVNHRFIDGYHIGQFEKQLTERIARLK